MLRRQHVCVRRRFLFAPPAHAGGRLHVNIRVSTVPDVHAIARRHVKPANQPTSQPASQPERRISRPRGSHCASRQPPKALVEHWLVVANGDRRGMTLLPLPSSSRGFYSVPFPHLQLATAAAMCQILSHNTHAVPVLEAGHGGRAVGNGKKKKGKEGRVVLGRNTHPWRTPCFPQEAAGPVSRFQQ